MCPRQMSSSSFADAFDDARRKLDAMGVQEPGEDEVLSPSLSSSSSATDVSATYSAPGESPSPLSPATPTTVPITPMIEDVADDFAFAFDIDGVLIRGGRPIPEAVEAMKVLNGENEWGVKV